MEDRNYKLQNLLLEIIKEVVRICEKYNINYYMDGGTHLGAIRHKGFIPWDDDIDIAMKRKDYDLFLKVCPVELDKDIYYVQNEWIEKEYAFCFTKIQLNGTEIIEDFSKNVRIKHGIFIDIFPYDNLPDNLFFKKKMLVENYLLKNLLWIKCGYGTTNHKKKLNYKVLRLFSYFISTSQLKRKRYTLLTKYNMKDTKNVFTGDYPNAVLDNVWFLTSRKYRFENLMLKGFVDYDSYLKRLYDDYMLIPEIQDRATHTLYKINYGRYEHDIRRV